MKASKAFKKKFEKAIAAAEKDHPLGDSVEALGRRVAIYKLLKGYEGSLEELDFVAGVGELIEAGLV